jgi:8-amino-7-oxononanoate synthase
MMQPAKSNPIPQTTDQERHILTDKSSYSAFWSHLERSLAERRALGLGRECVVSESLRPTTLLRNGVKAVHFGSNDYLGLTWHPEVRRAALESTLSVAKFGSGASPLVTGHSPVHESLVRSISEFEQTESAIVFSSGYAANLGTLAALAGRNDVIFSDSLNHASLIDGCRLSKALVIVYPHCDFVALAELVKRNRHRGRFAFVATDSVFSMDGDLAPLPEINSLCHEFDMQCILDEAHATGVYGRNGRGLIEHTELSSERIVSIGTLSKAVGCSGGFVAGPKVLIDWLSNHARSWIYSTASTIPNAAAANKAISLVQSMFLARAELANKAISLRAGLAALGFEVGTGDSPIIPVYVNDATKVLQFSQRLLDAGIYVPAIRPPTVPENKSLLRISLSVQHSDVEIERLVQAFSDLHSPSGSFCNRPIGEAGPPAP